MKQGVVSSKSEYGYLMPWNEYYAPKALNEILQKGIRAKVSMKNFTNGNTSYDYGNGIYSGSKSKFKRIRIICVLAKCC